MASIDAQEFKLNVKNFQPKVISRSISELFFYSTVADKILQCFPAHTKSETFSMLSFLPICILSAFRLHGDRLWFVLALIALFVHQVMDIANKKQAYRLKEYNLKSFYIDHIYDSLSCGIIVGVIARLMQFKAQNVWISMFIFGFLPFYVSHIAMVSTGHQQFQAINPVSQGLLIVQILLLICSIYPDFLKVQVFGNITIVYAVTVLCSIWLALYLLKQLWRIKSSKQKNESSMKQFFIIMVIGYVFFENTIIQKKLMLQPIYFAGLNILNITHFSLLISNILVNFGVKRSYPDLTLNTIFVTASVVAIYSSIFLIPMQYQKRELSCKISIWVIAVVQFFYFVYIHRTALNQISLANSE